MTITVMRRAPRRHPPQKLKKLSLRKYSARVGFLLILPWILGFALLKAFPILAALWYSFTNFHMLQPDQIQFIGLQNYIAFFNDPRAINSLIRSLNYFFMTVPIEMIAALLLAAVFANEHLRAKRLLRTLFFMPSIIPAVAISIIVSGLLNRDSGWINELILRPLNLQNSLGRNTFPIVLALWTIGPGFLIMLGAMLNVPREIYEARGEVDGAGPLARFVLITLPMISPAVFFSLVINMISSFGGVALLDRGLPYSRSLSPMESYISNQLFSGSYNLGYASALAWVMFVVVMLITLVLFFSTRFWVHFPEEDENEEISSSRRARPSDKSTLTLRLWEFTGNALLNLFIWIVLVVYLFPLSYMLITSVKTSAQIRDSKSPIWPAHAATFNYNGRSLEIYKVPTASGVQHWALAEPHIKYSLFVDPQNPDLGLIRWNGYWGSLTLVYLPSVTLENFVTLWQTFNYPNLLRNTLVVIGLGEIGVLFSSIMVAYGFARFRIPGGKFLFFLLIGTIMIPDSITLVPSFVFYGRVLNWTGTFYPLLVPQFFGSAIYIFLLRQNFKTIPRDLDEAAMLDGAGPLRTLVLVILPQSIPTVVTVALLHFFNAWNELKMASLYLGVRPDLQTIAFSTQTTQSVGSTTEGLQAAALLLMVIPLVVLFLSQRYFMQDMVIANVEK